MTELSWSDNFHPYGEDATVFDLAGVPSNPLLSIRGELCIRSPFSHALYVQLGRSTLCIEALPTEIYDEVGYDPTRPNNIYLVRNEDTGDLITFHDGFDLAPDESIGPDTPSMKNACAIRKGDIVVIGHNYPKKMKKNPSLICQRNLAVLRKTTA